MLLSFPLDISLYVLSFLSIRDLRSLLLVSRSARSLIDENEQTIYHQVAILHHLVSPEASFEDIKLKESRRDAWLGDVETWKELCTFSNCDRSARVAG